MEVIAITILGLTVGAIALFVVAVGLLVSLYRKIKLVNPRLALILKLIIILLLMIPVGLFIYQSYANSRGYDTNNIWLMIIMSAPIVLTAIVSLLIGATIYLNQVNKK